jgi:hypothetical protein
MILGVVVFVGSLGLNGADAPTDDPRAARALPAGHLVTKTDVECVGKTRGGCALLLGRWTDSSIENGASLTTKNTIQLPQGVTVIPVRIGGDVTEAEAFRPRSLVTLAFSPLAGSTGGSATIRGVMVVGRKKDPEMLLLGMTPAEIGVLNDHIGNAQTRIAISLP